MRVLRTGIVSCVLALAVASPAAGQAPKGHIDAIKAVFDAQNFTTHYIVENITGFTAPVHVTWSLELTCVDADCPDNTGTLKAPKPDVDKACNNDGVGTDALENET